MIVGILKEIKADSVSVISSEARNLDVCQERFLLTSFVEMTSVKKA